MSKTTQVGVRLTDDELARLDQLGGNRSETVRSLLDSQASIVAHVPSNDINEYDMVFDMAPESSSMSKLETYLAATQAGIAMDLPALMDAKAVSNLGEQVVEAIQEEGRHRQELMASVDLKELRQAGGSIGVNNPMMIDPTIRAMMQLSEFYALDGEINQMINVPLEMGFQDYDFPTGDEGAKREAREFFETVIDGHKLLEELWCARQIHGQAYPTRVYDGKQLSGILVPNGKHIAVGRMPGLSETTYSYVPTSLDTARALMDAEPSFLYSTSEWAWNEVAVQLWGIPLDPKAITHLHVPKFQWNYYAVPPLARATRAIDSRRFLEEMARATIEGVKNQLWVFKLENPRPGEAKLLASTLAGARGARTGYLVWGANLDVEQFVPASIDNLLAPEALWSYTMKVYRAMGVTIRMVSGESPDRGSSSNAIVDVDVSLDRMMYSRGSFQRFMQGITDEVVGPGKAQFRLADVALKVAETIKNKLAPLLNFGLLSPSSAFSKAGLDADAEWKQLEADNEKRTKLIHPYSGFAQDGPTGRATSTEPGRTPGRVETQPRQQAQAVQASIESDYAAAVELAWATLLADSVGTPEDRQRAVEAFMGALFALGDQYRPQAYDKGWHDNGGVGPVDQADVERWKTFDYANANDLATELERRAAAGEDAASLGYRVSLYAIMGYRMAYTAGLFAAKKRMGFLGWRRLLRPYASKAGPCSVCKADAGVWHDIGESFFDHPNGVCGMSFIGFRMSPLGPSEASKIPPAVIEV